MFASAFPSPEVKCREEDIKRSIHNFYEPATSPKYKRQVTIQKIVKLSKGSKDTPRDVDE